MREKGSYLLKELTTTADLEEAASQRPPPPPPPPIPPPAETKLSDQDLTGYGASALLIFNGVMTGFKAGFFIEPGVLPGAIGAWAAELNSKSPANAYFGTISWGAASAHYGLQHYLKRPSYIPAWLLCLTSLGMTGSYYFQQLQYEMKTVSEKEKDNPW